MSATSITDRTRESVYLKLEDQLIEQGDKYILEREFLLGEGACKKKSNYLVQYTDLLCNTNCDINSLIEKRIKGLSDIQCKTKRSFENELSRLSDQYYDWLNQGNAGNFMEYILSQANISTCVSWNQSEW